MGHTPFRLPRPTRRFHFQIDVSGDTKADALHLLRTVMHAIQNGGDIYADGTAAATGHMVMRENPAMTHEKYVEAIERYDRQEISDGR